MSTPEALRDAGMQAAENAADPRIIAMIDAAIDEAIATRRPFTVNDIRAIMPTVTSQGLVGSRFRSAALRKPARMVQTGRWIKSDLPSTRSARVAEWVGVPNAKHYREFYKGRIVCACGDFYCASLDAS